MNKTALVIVLSAVAATASSQGAFAETEYQKFKRVERDNVDIRRDSRDIHAGSICVGTSVNCARSAMSATMPSVKS